MPAMPEPAAPRFDAAFRRTLQALFVWRRDVRRFRRDPLPAGTLERLVSSACLAPSVGLSQPWRFVLVEQPDRRRAVRDSFERCDAAAQAGYARGAEAAPGGEARAAAYARLRLAGLDDAPVQLAVFCDPSTPQGHGLGRQTMPQAVEHSVVGAVGLLWLAARAEGIGVGWVSILEPGVVQAALDVPEAWRLVAYLCLGYPAAEDDQPELERLGWERRASTLPLWRR